MDFPFWKTCITNLFSYSKGTTTKAPSMEIHSMPMIYGVMTKTIIQAAILMVELVSIITTVDGTPIAQ